MPEPTMKPRRTRRSKALQASMTAVSRPGEMPLDYLLRLMRDESATPARRDRAAVVAAPYCHARLAEKTRKTQEAEASREAGGAGSLWAGDLDVDADGRLRQ